MSSTPGTPQRGVFTGLVFHFENLPNEKKAELTKVINNNGGTISYVFGKKVTHLLLQKSDQLSSFKQEKMKEYGVKLMTEKTLLEMAGVKSQKGGTSLKSSGSTPIPKSENSNATPAPSPAPTPAPTPSTEPEHSFQVPTTSIFASKPTTSSSEIMGKSLTTYRPAATAPVSAPRGKAQGKVLLQNRRGGSGESRGDSPTVTLVLPASGTRAGNFQIGIYGLGFVPGPHFRVRVGNVVCTNYEFHSESSVVCTVPPLSFSELISNPPPHASSLGYGIVPTTNGNEVVEMSGDNPTQLVTVSASNDGGHTFGFGVSFHFNDVETKFVSNEANQRLALLSGQLFNLRRAIVNIQKMELELTSQLGQLLKTDISVPDSLMTGLGNLLSASDERRGPSPSSGSSSFDSSPSSTPALPVKKPPRSKKEISLREVRIFISSPFKDMQQERDVIVKSVVPKLRKICDERDVICSYVDLRWGVTQVQSEQAVMLLRVLREIEKCNLFVGCLGERYGWCINPDSDKKTNELLKKSLDIASAEFDWVNSFRDRSITELEMQVVLSQQSNLAEGEEKKRAWFYFRDPYFIEEVAEKDKTNFRSESEFHQEKLENLKLEISSSEFPVKPYIRPNQLSEVMFGDLKEYIDKKFPQEVELSVLEKERMRHNIELRRITRVYLPNEKNFISLDKYVNSDVCFPLVISGETGIGKSALIGNWGTRHHQHHPEDVVVLHFVGASASSGSPSFILWRFMNEIKEVLEIEDPIPSLEEPKKITSEFQVWLERAMKKNPQKRRVIFLLDGLDKLDAREQAHEMVWFPRDFPEQIRVILTCSAPSRPLDVFTRRKYPKLELGLLEEGERKAFTQTYLDLYVKKLSDKQELKIAAAKQGGNPRFLQTLLDDISVFGEHEELDKKIDFDLKASNTAELYAIVLARLEKDYDKENKGVVREFMSLIWASKRGLLELELSLLLEKKGINETQWNDLFVVAGDLLNNCGGLLSFSNVDIQTAVERTYLKTDADKEKYHADLAAFFVQHDNPERVLEELPFHYEKSKKFDLLKDYLANLVNFDRMYTNVGKFDLFRYWRSVEANTKFEAAAVYTHLVEEGKFPLGLVVSDLMFKLAQAMDSMAKYKGAEFLYLKARGRYEMTSQKLQVAAVDAALANLYSLQLKFPEAESMLMHLMDIYTKEKGSEDVDVARTLNSLGTLYTQTQRFNEALSVLERAKKILEKTVGVNDNAYGDNLYNLGCVHFIQRKLLLAEEMLTESLRIKEELFGDWNDDVSRVLNRLGTLYTEQDQFNDAEECFERALLIRENIYGPNHSRVSQTLKSMISIYEIQEKYNKAIECGLRATEIVKSIFGPQHYSVGTILIRLATIYYVMNKKVDGKKLLLEAIEIRKSQFGESHKETLEAIELLHSMEGVPKKPAVPEPSKRAIPPPPPPPPRSGPAKEGPTRGGIPPPPPPPPRPKPSAAGGPPPPPPPPGGRAPPPPPPGAPPKSTAPDKITEDAMGILKKATQVSDRSGAKDLAVAMMGARERKMKFKKPMMK